MWPHWGVLTVSVKARCSIEVVSEASGIFPVNFCTKYLLWHVHVHFDCAGSHKMLAPEVSAAIFPVNFHTKWLLWNGRVHFACAGSHKTSVAGLASGTFPVNFHTKWLLCNVHVHFDCAGSHKVCFPVLGSVFLLNIILLNISIFLLLLLLPLLLNIHIIIFLSSSSSSSSSHHLPLIIFLIIFLSSSSSPPPPPPPHHHHHHRRHCHRHHHHRRHHYHHQHHHHLLFSSSVSSSSSTSPSPSTLSSTLTSSSAVEQYPFTAPTLFGVSCRDNIFLRGPTPPPGSVRGWERSSESMLDVRQQRSQSRTLGRGPGWALWIWEDEIDRANRAIFAWHPALIKLTVNGRFTLGNVEGTFGILSFPQGERSSKRPLLHWPGPLQKPQRNQGSTGASQGIHTENRPADAPWSADKLIKLDLDQAGVKSEDILG